MSNPRDDYFVSVDWLAERLRAPGVVVVDASWHLPTAGRDASEEYLAGHIPGAVYFDIDAISEQETDLPHMLPRPEVFSSRMRKLGIGDGQTIVVYDSAGLFSAPRVWWTFKVMGARSVLILDGGLPAWTAAGHDLESGPVRRQERHFTARLDNSAVRDFNAVRSALAASPAQVVDARSAERFRGAAPEPRPGLKSGHMPGSTSLPFGELVADGRLKDADAVRAIFEARGVDLSRPVVATCGSGVTAAVLALAGEIAGAKAVSIYDGSWAEWGARGDAEVATG